MRRLLVVAVFALVLLSNAFAQGQSPGQPPSQSPPPGQASPPGQSQPSNPRSPQQTQQPPQGAQGEDHPEDPYLKYQTGVEVRVTQVEIGAFPMVRAFVSVTDENGGLIKTLKEGDFEVTENGTPVEGLHFANRDEANLPLAIMFVVDVSGSMAPAIDLEKQAIRDFVGQLKPEDRVGLVTFSDAALTKVPLTTNHDELLREVDALVPEYQTALWDGIYTGMQELLADAEPGRRALVVLSDGLDNRSVENVGTVLDTWDEEAYQQNKGFSIFTLGLGLDLDRQGLTSVADRTGGTYIESPTPEDLNGVYETILNQIQGEYLLEYDSPIETQPGQIIDLAVKVLPVREAEAGKYTYRSPGLSKALARAIWPGLIAISVLTLVLLIATIFKLTRRAWLTVMITPLEGREHTLRSDTATIGSSEAADIRVGRDAALLPYHATLRESQDGFILEAADPDAPIIVGDRMLAKKLLRNGDRFILGTTNFSFRERVDRPGSTLLDAAGVEVEQLAPLTVGSAALQTNAAVATSTSRTKPAAISGLAGPYAGRRLVLKAGTNAIGRTEGDIILDADTQISRRHCVIELSADSASVTDLGSTNGTSVNGARLAPNAAQPVFAGDTVQVGASLFQLE